MDRRTFNTIVGGGAITLGAGAWRGFPDTVEAEAGGSASHPVKWPEGAYRRVLVDTHVQDWDPALLARFDASDYVATIANAGFQSVMQYANSRVGLCLWRKRWANSTLR